MKFFALLVSRIASLLAAPSAIQIAQTELETAQRELMVAESNAEFAASIAAAHNATVEYNRKRINRLKTRILDIGAAHG